jgi:hypothetical protein
MIKVNSNKLNIDIQSLESTLDFILHLATSKGVALCFSAQGQAPVE